MGLFSFPPKNHHDVNDFEIHKVSKNIGTSTKYPKITTYVLRDQVWASFFPSSILFAWYCEGKKLKLMSDTLVSKILFISASSFPLLSKSFSSVQLISNSNLYPATNSGPEAPLLWRNHAEELLIRVLSLLVYVEGLLGDLLEVAAAKTCSALVTNCTGVPSTFTELTYLEYSPRNSCLALPWQPLVWLCSWSSISLWVLLGYPGYQLPG